MKIKTILAIILAATIGCVWLSSCSDSKSYAELLTDENHAVNAFLANNRVVGSVPSDTVFEVGSDAPYYCLDEDRNVYMQVLRTGTPGNRATADQQIFFRFMRHSLLGYDALTGEFDSTAWGNSEEMTFGSTSFRFQNFTLSSSSQWGSGLQMPLNFLPIDCEVNLVVKSQYGLSDEISNVTPFLYNVRYFPAISQ